MKLVRSILSCLACITIIVIPVFSSSPVGSKDEDKKITLSGMTAFEIGQFVRGHHRQKEFEYRPWLNRLYGQIGIHAKIKNRLRIILIPEVKLWYDSYPWIDIGDRSPFPFRMRSKVTIAQGEGIVSIGNYENPFMEIAAGMLQYKYNPEAHNLGEYLFRTGTHPAYIFTSFDYAFARFPGFRITSTLFQKRVLLEALLTFEPDIHPVMDGSISFLAGYKHPGIFDKKTNLVNVGAGFSFDRAIPVSGEIIRTPDDNNNVRNKYYTASGEEKYYSFGGKKFMGRLSLDPKGILPEAFTSHFNNDDWKIFCEFAILGLKNIDKYNKVPVDSVDTIYVLDTTANYYHNRRERIPFMFGFNIPFPQIGKFRLWDLCSFQMEYYGWPFTNSFYDQQFGNENPIPKPAQTYPERAYEMDSWKFSLFMKKEVLKGFSLIGQVARDHTHHDIFVEGQRDEEEVFTKTDNIEKFGHIFNPKKWGEYGWWLKLQYNF